MCNLIYIDETGIDNNISKIRGWAEKGCKLVIESLGFRTKRITLIVGNGANNNVFIPTLSLMPSGIEFSTIIAASILIVL